jgi:rhodanese-related sulfurtransferase
MRQMHSCSLLVIFLLAESSVGQTRIPYGASEALEGYATNGNALNSYSIRCEVLMEAFVSGLTRKPEKSRRTCDIRVDGTRGSSRSHAWHVDPTKPGAGAVHSYLSLTFDGQRYIAYRRPDPNKPGRVYLDDTSNWPAERKDWETNSLLYGHGAAVLLGYYPGTFERVDEILRHARSLSLRDRAELIGDSPCYVVEAKTPQGDYTLWFDPQRGFNIARAEVRRSREEGHLSYGQPMSARTDSFVLENVRFQQVEDVWVAVEADYATRTQENDDEGSVSWSKAHITITDITLNPDHDALRSFTGGDIPNGTEVMKVPVAYIRYAWVDGKLVTKINKKVVRRIDEIVAGLAPADRSRPALSAPPDTNEPNEANLEVKEDAYKPDPRAIIVPRPYCGLYCLYSVLRLKGWDVGFRELVKPEYVGSGDGSTMAELSKAARDHNLFAGVAARLTTRGLSQCPYPAILHMKADVYHAGYDHYELFLGTEDGQARLFDPPEPPRLVPFPELASLWDGYALALSDKPFEIDAIFGPDRQRLLMYAALGALALVATHLLLGRLRLAESPRPRRRQLALSVGQGGALGMLALLAGGLYHLTAEAGLVANAQVTTAFQKAYLGGFVPKIGIRRVRQVLGTDTVLIDARYAEDYQAGHLAGALSLPIDSNEARWQKTMAPVPKGSSIVVYCQSAGCKFAQRVASKLVEDGYARVCVYKGGWAQWVARNDTPAQNKTPGEKGVEPNGTATEPARPDGT